MPSCLPLAPETAMFQSNVLPFQSQQFASPKPHYQLGCRLHHCIQREAAAVNGGRAESVSRTIVLIAGSILQPLHTQFWITDFRIIRKKQHPQLILRCDYPLASSSALVNQLETVKGKKTYGYLPKGVKKIVDEIIDLMEQLPVINGCYAATTPWRVARSNQSAATTLSGIRTGPSQ